MKKCYYLIMAIVFMGVVLAEYACDIRVASAASMHPEIIITEMQPGTVASASQEFIELYNQSATDIDLSKGGWQLQIASSTATDWTKAKTIALSGTFYAGRYMLLASNYTLSGDTDSYLKEYASAQFTSGLSASSGHIRLATKTPLTTTTIDTLEWSTKNAAGQFVSPPIMGSSFALDTDMRPGSSLKRSLDSNDYFKVSDGGSVTDFILSSCPSPTATLGSTETPAAPSDEGTIATTIDTVNPSCAPVDSADGSVSTPTTEPPAVLLPSEVLPSKSFVMPAADIGLELPQISELLPNPASPQTDAHDEFIELYNGNDAAFDLTGFGLSAGTNSSQRFVFPTGTTLPAHSFRAFYAYETGLSLSNSGGFVVLLGPSGSRLQQTDAYGTAKEGQAWVRAQGRWAWSDTPTPGAANIVHLPAAKTKAAVAASSKAKVATAKKTTTKKGAAAKTAKKKSSKTKKTSGVTAFREPPQRTPVHPGVLALVAGFAILYGVYEYRGDLANRIYQFRSNRTARRALRKSHAGR